MQPAVPRGAGRERRGGGGGGGGHRGAAGAARAPGPSSRRWPLCGWGGVAVTVRGAAEARVPAGAARSSQKGALTAAPCPSRAVLWEELAGAVSHLLPGEVLAGLLLAASPEGKKKPWCCSVLKGELAVLLVEHGQLV